MMSQILNGTQVVFHHRCYYTYTYLVVVVFIIIHLFCYYYFDNYSNILSKEETKDVDKLCAARTHLT